MNIGERGSVGSESHSDSFESTWKSTFFDFVFLLKSVHFYNEITVEKTLPVEHGNGLHSFYRVGVLDHTDSLEADKFR